MSYEIPNKLKNLTPYFEKSADCSNFACPGHFINFKSYTMATKKDELTPMMKQFFTLKAKHPDALMLFRCGDFYETYCEDAVTASKILGITLTRRSNGGSKPNTEMAGFPHYALDTYLPKLIRAGKRVASVTNLRILNSPRNS